MEDTLFDWIMDTRDSGLCVNQRSIKAKASELMSRSDNNFKASSGWLYRFLKRKNLVLRRVTTTGRELPRKAPQTINNFLNECSAKFQVDGFDRKCLLNMDETSIYIDSPSKI